LDYNYAIKNKLIPEDYYVWWGYEDSKLFNIAKKELQIIAKENKPFNFTILTADTHFVDGYLDKSCKFVFNSKYANSIYCSDIMVSNFIEWIKSQDFYKNTTIILVGDHLTMQESFYANNNYNRVIYNAFINSKKNTNTYNNRIFTSMDLYPTTLSALGVNIAGNRLGLGTDLFSNSKTLAEKYGFEYLNNELSKKSLFYNNLMGKSYFEIKKNIDL
jgi:phosphoglycerol transferase